MGTKRNNFTARQRMDKGALKMKKSGKKIFSLLSMTAILAAAICFQANASTVANPNNHIDGSNGSSQVACQNENHEDQYADQDYASPTVQNDKDFQAVQRYLYSVGDGVLTHFGYDPQQYTKISMDDKNLPHQLVSYYFMKLNLPLGSSKPVVYQKTKGHYLIVFQNGDGTKILKDISVGSDGQLTLTEKSAPGTKVTFQR